MLELLLDKTDQETSFLLPRWYFESRICQGRSGLEDEWQSVSSKSCRESAYGWTFRVYGMHYTAKTRMYSYNQYFDFQACNIRAESDFRVILRVRRSKQAEPLLPDCPCPLDRVKHSEQYMEGNSPTSMHSMIRLREKSDRSCRSLVMIVLPVTREWDQNALE
ncbi:hypothetical protein L202_07287 [Cryptococcus amylolentus CBS 6039]|uniref:Uncharacterized protein n=1 Tax=Cryptococcus amylolentus CBS 6039 TaxID=1295533 RepID=A0A1E3HBN3_9TREE|nr:hypothetical protein L202_07287 [Cryptococcus amylolentus CBS 6039]ODN73752.1 hypothetical protein L202_07287 [Cryptococcus amylolentus CBS 6039]